MSDSIKFSIVIPTIGRSESLSRALNSAVSQSLLPLEVILVDDSAEQSLDLVQFSNMLLFGDLLRIYKTGGRKGASVARNLGYQFSKGSWVAFLDDDDEFYKNKLECVSSHLRASNRDIAVVSHPAEVIMVNQNVVYRSRNRYEFNDLFFERLLVSNIVGGTPVALVNKSLIGPAPLFNESLPALEDKELWLRLAKSGSEFSFLDKALTRVFHTTGTDSLSKGWSANESAYRKILEIYKDDIKGLTNSQRKALEQTKELARANRYIMSEMKYSAALKFLLVFIKYRSVSALVSALATLLGINTYFKLKSYLYRKQF